MSDRNRLSAGDYLIPLPEGIGITLQYDDKGVIKNVLSGYESTGTYENITKDMLSELISNKLVPNVISLKNGATYVEGILYTEDVCYDPGELPDCIQETLREKFISDPTKFKFYAITVRSLAAMFRGSVAIRQWLTFSKFNLPPGYLIPTRFEGTDDNYLQVLEDLVGGNKYIFKYPLIPEYVLFHNQDIKHGKFHLIQIKLSSVKKTVSRSGVISAELRSDSMDGSIVVPYSDVIQYDLQKNSDIILDEYDNILYSHNNKIRKSKGSERITCDFCGKLIDVPKVGTVMCSDPNCNSRLYPRVSQFLSTLNLPVVSYDRYKEIIKEQGVGFAVPDILTVDEFEDLKIDVSLRTILRAIVPMYIEPDTNYVNLLCNSCNNAVDTLEYYLSHTSKLEFDLGKDVATRCSYIINWFDQYPENLVDLKTALHDKHINIVDSDKRFDGPPIFRGKSIVLTGTFYHGSQEDIESILKSYGGTVVPDFKHKVDCVIIGGLQEHIDGSIIREARNLRIPIFEEYQFFSEYDIESDLAENL